ncbi:orotate phosphoribosyltransferase [Chitinasiproducens palmae]|uniref:Orotate phosphoribosyltransferase n=1 Tax=Chitinasiproducens palmae TaxID=1770053 RepID=A0A1H2PNK7_9BURK|nr:orotate phosphoribosyltransferase [Chitinasiproducens palmae]SDV48273.1 orotate phosphoribosyltransferase [Chitinasiproducens palmae]
MKNTDRPTIAEITARILLETRAIHFNTAQPFKLTSGRMSPTYIDCRKLISFPRARRALMEMAQTTLNEQAGFEQFDAVAGGETAGIPFAAWLADRFDLPMQYVRKKPKGFGRNAQIEGELKEGSRVLLVEDLASEGTSKVNFVQALRTAGAQVDHVFVLFYYDIFAGSQKVFDDIGVKLHYLATWWDVLRVARDGDYFDAATLDGVEKFLHAPESWEG